MILPHPKGWGILNKMEKEIAAKTEIGNLKIEKSGREGIKLTIELPKKGDVSIVVDKFELAEALELNSEVRNSSQP